MLRATLVGGDRAPATASAYLTATIQETLRRRPVLPEHGAAPRQASRSRSAAGDYPDGMLPGRQRLPAPPRRRRLPGPLRVPARALPRLAARGPTRGSRSAAGGGDASARRFAMLEMKIVLPAVLRAYEPAGRANAGARAGHGGGTSRCGRARYRECRSRGRGAPGSPLRPESGAYPRRPIRRSCAGVSRTWSRRSSRAASPPFLSLTLAPVSAAIASERSGSWPTSRTSPRPAARSSGRSRRRAGGRRARPRGPATRRRARRCRRARTFGEARQASSSAPSAFSARPAALRLLLALPGQPALGVAAGARRLVLRLSMSQQPDHAVR